MKILTSCTLLIPAFALPVAPADRFLAAFTAPGTLPYHSHNFLRKYINLCLRYIP